MSTKKIEKFTIAFTFKTRPFNVGDMWEWY
jgi:hypothetical protein